MKKKNSKIQDTAPPSPPSPVIDIGGLILRLEFSFWNELFFFILFFCEKKTAEAVEMELVVCRCMREQDYLGVMSALLNTITPYRSEGDLRRIYCLLKRVWKSM